MAAINSKKDALQALQDTYQVILANQSVPPSKTFPSGVAYVLYGPTLQNWLLSLTTDNNRIYVLRPRVDTRTSLIYEVDTKKGTVTRLKPLSKDDDKQFALELEKLFAANLEGKGLKSKAFCLDDADLRF